jgi:hypothetical protein
VGISFIIIEKRNAHSTTGAETVGPNNQSTNNRLVLGKSTRLAKALKQHFLHFLQRKRPDLATWTYHIPRTYSTMPTFGIIGKRVDDLL